jgi:hypothetical protein
LANTSPILSAAFTKNASTIVCSRSPRR